MVQTHLCKRPRLFEWGCFWTSRGTLCFAMIHWNWYRQLFLTISLYGQNMLLKHLSSRSATCKSSVQHQAKNLPWLFSIRARAKKHLYSYGCCFTSVSITRKTVTKQFPQRPVTSCYMVFGEYIFRVNVCIGRFTVQYRSILWAAFGFVSRIDFFRSFLMVIRFFFKAALFIHLHLLTFLVVCFYSPWVAKSHEIQP